MSLLRSAAQALAGPKLTSNLHCATRTTTDHSVEVRTDSPQHTTKGNERLVSEFGNVLLEDTDLAGIIRIDDGKVNAFTQPLLRSRAGALDIALAQDKAALVLGSKRSLSAGFPLSYRDHRRPR
jgi:hypothetical protein